MARRGLVHRASITILAVGVFGSRAWATDAFKVDCDLPMDSIARHRQIDSTCANQGKASGSDENHAQNRAKNNFCASGDAVMVKIKDFKALQKAVDKAVPEIPFGTGTHLPPDRARLVDISKTDSGQDIGEGTVVGFVGFVLDAHYSNYRKHSNGKAGESVNCDHEGKAFNDIHIALLESLPQDSAKLHECDTITAEVIPHHRPELWDADAINRTHRSHHPVRITGQLFFDGSHEPCRPGKPHSPKRTSVWEIHPVYAIDVCSGTTIAGCDINNESKWTPLDEWAPTEQEDDGDDS